MDEKVGKLDNRAEAEFKIEKYTFYILSQNRLYFTSLWLSLMF